MAYDAIQDEWIEAGEPTRKEIFQKLKANQEFFNAEIDALQQTAKVSVYNLTVGGSINQYTTAQINSRLPVYGALFDARIVEVKITLLGASSSGTLSLDIKRSTDGVTFNTILSSAVTLTGTVAGSTSGAVDFLSEAAQEFSQGDYLSIELPTRQTGQGKFLIEIYAVLTAGEGE